MKTLYIQCNMGAAGDMLTAALLELLPDEQKGEALAKLNSLLPDVEVAAEPSAKCGIFGTHVTVKVHGEEEETHDHHHDHEHHHHHDHNHEHHHHHDHDHEHHHHHDHDHEHHHHDHDHGHHHHHSHSSYADVKHQIDHFDLPWEVKNLAFKAYGLIADAESKAHGVPVDQVHFHEVGEKDAIMDVTAACYLAHLLAPEQIIVSPIHVGSGSVRTAHGILPVPAPATADILTGMPWYSSEVKGELCTPTGAALLKTFADSYGPMPVMNVAKTGYGMGKKDFAEANCVRAFLGETMESFAPNSKICELMANLDDMTPEAIGFATGILMEEGALDAYVIPVTMKKNRPGHVLNCICREADADKFARLILKHTTTFGVRRHTCDRYTLEVSFEEKETPYGIIRTKTGRGYGVEKTKLEYEDAAKCAREHGVSLQEIYR